jgi:hypothetical protein
MKLIEISVIRDFVAIFGVIAGFSYYVLTVRNAQRSQKTNERTQQLQFLVQMTSLMGYEGNKMGIELMNMEWSDYDEFERKYGSDNNQDNYAKRITLWTAYDILGYALKMGLIDRDLLLQNLGYGPITFWAKFKGVVEGIRIRYLQPTGYENFEYLASESIKWFKEKGYDIRVPDTFYRYIPDQ